jgi:hypothetical protein
LLPWAGQEACVDDGLKKKAIPAVTSLRRVFQTEGTACAKARMQKGMCVQNVKCNVVLPKEVSHCHDQSCIVDKYILCLGNRFLRCQRRQSLMEFILMCYDG